MPVGNVIRKATRLDEVRITRAIPKDAVASLRPSAGGGIGWRDGVPHIIIHAGDTTPICPFPHGYVVPEFIQPVSARGLEVPIGLMRDEPIDLSETSYIAGWIDTGDGYWETFNETWPVRTVHYYRSGEAGQAWVSPAGAATLPGTITALNDFDVAVMTITDENGMNLDPDDGIFSENEMSYSQLMDSYNHPDGNHRPENWLSPTQIALLPDQYGGGSEPGRLSWWGACMAFLTGAVSQEPTPHDLSSGPTAMSYRWNGDERWANPTNTNADEFVAFLIPKVLELAELLGNANTFDVAFCIDGSGSFSFGGSVCVKVFNTIIDQLRELGKDIFVGVAKFSEYSLWSYPNGGTSVYDRAFVLQYPISSIENQESYGAMVQALIDDNRFAGGGDTPETQLDALFQICSGVGYDGSDGTYVWNYSANESVDQNTQTHGGFFESLPRSTGDPIIAFLATSGTADAEVSDGLPEWTEDHSEVISGTKDIYAWSIQNCANDSSDTLNWEWDTAVTAASVMVSARDGTITPTEGSSGAVNAASYSGPTVGSGRERIIVFVWSDTGTTMTNGALIRRSSFIDSPTGVVEAWAAYVDGAHQINLTAYTGNIRAVYWRGFLVTWRPDGDISDSGEAGIRGAPVEIFDQNGDWINADLIAWLQSELGYSLAEAEAFSDAYQSDDTTQAFVPALGYIAPGSSGDIPEFSGASARPRGGALAVGSTVRVWSYEG